MTKLQRKRRAARERRTNRRYDLAALSHHFAALQRQIASVESSAYHRKRPRWLYCHGRKGQSRGLNFYDYVSSAQCDIPPRV